MIFIRKSVWVDKNETVSPPSAAASLFISAANSSTLPEIDSAIAIAASLPLRSIIPYKKVIHVDHISGMKAADRGIGGLICSVFTDRDRLA